MTELTHQKLRVTFVSFVCASSVFAAAIVIIFFSEKSRQQKNLDKAYSVVRSVVNDVNVALNNLNSLNYTSCDKGTLAAMQRTMFKSQFIKEVGFLRDGFIVCTTSGGLLDVPVPEPVSTYATSRKTKILIDQAFGLLSEEQTSDAAVMVQLGSYNVVVHGGYFSFVDIPLKHWEILYIDKMTTYHVHGSNNIYEAEFGLSNRSNLGLSGGLYSQVCDPALGYCAVAIKSLKDILTSNRSQLFISFLIGTSVLLLCLHRLYPYRARISSIDYRIKSGISSGAFYPTYQPIVHLASEDVVGCEVLGRYKDRFGGLYPDKFIPKLKEFGMTWAYTIHQVNQVCDQLARFPLPKGFKVGFNIFPEDLTSGKIDELITIAKPFLKCFMINFEIIEDEVLDQAEAKTQIQKLVAAGFLVSIDDFGTGYSNLGHLESISCHYLKIDRKFIGDIEKGSLLSSLVPQISEIANRFGLECVAEGVENSKQKELLQKQGISFGQGWHFGKPMPIQQWSVFLTLKLFRKRGSLTPGKQIDQKFDGLPNQCSDQASSVSDLTTECLPLGFDSTRQSAN